MRIAVVGLWHLGCVTAACLARAGHNVVAIDPDAKLIAELRAGQPPVFEPGLSELIQEETQNGRLRFESDRAPAMDAEIAWITFDTPIDDNDVPQPLVVVDHVKSLLPHLPTGCLVLISSQLPVGTTRSLSQAALADGRTVTFGYIPENLRLGQAIAVFTRPERIVVGLQSENNRAKVETLLSPFTSNLVWMGIESAEMTKHAVNAFLANSVSFMNEVAAICERVGANAKEVESGLKSEARIGPKAYLSPGGAFEGGTLARDVTTLADLAHELAVPASLMPAIRESNQRHRTWPLRKLKEKLGTLAGHRIAVLGLTYKPGTSTLRRSGAIDLISALHAEGSKVTAFDPVVRALPTELAAIVSTVDSPAEALSSADAMVLATPWPEFRTYDWAAMLSTMARPIVVDASWFLIEHLKNQPGIIYAAVGHPWTG
jgi:UDPglucose 6-dehydrogenase